MSAARDWAELLRLPALFTVPGDALAGAVAGGGRPGARTLGAVAASLCLYSAGMALNDWADREEDARERPGRPLPSGRVRPTAALAAAGGLTAAGLGCAALAGRRTAAVAVPLAATVWAYDLRLKHTPLGPAAMGAARALDLLMGAASTGAVGRALPSALAVGAHTGAVTVVSRHETRGGTALPAVSALAVTAAVTAGLVRGAAAVGPRDGSGPAGRGRGRRSLGAASGRTSGSTSGRSPGASVGSGIEDGSGCRPRAASPTTLGTPPPRPGRPDDRSGGPVGLGGGFGGRVVPFGGGFGGRVVPFGGGQGGRLAPIGGGFGGRPAPVGGGLGGRLAPFAAAAFAATAARPLLHAALNPSPQLTQRAVGAGIRALVPLQAALAARAGAPATALLTAALAPVARRLGRKVSLT